MILLTVARIALFLDCTLCVSTPKGHLCTASLKMVKTHFEQKRRHLIFGEFEVGVLLLIRQFLQTRIARLALCQALTCFTGGFEALVPPRPRINQVVLGRT